MEPLALVLLAGWFLLSLLYILSLHGGGPLRKGMAWLERRDCLRLLSHWGLFAPEPVSGDCRLLIRDRLVSGIRTAWREVPQFGDRRPLHALWNPDLLPGTTLFCYMQRLAESGDLPAEARMESVPYRALARYVLGLPRSGEAVARQFVLVHTSPERPDGAPEPVFLSAFHPLEPDRALLPGREGD